MIGAEAVSGEALQRWHQREGCRPALFNAYGRHRQRHMHRVEPDSPTCCIGRPLPNVRMVVLPPANRCPWAWPARSILPAPASRDGYLNRPD